MVSPANPWAAAPVVALCAALNRRGSPLLRGLENNVCFLRNDDKELSPQFVMHCDWCSLLNGVAETIRANAAAGSPKQLDVASDELRGVAAYLKTALASRPRYDDAAAVDAWCDAFGSSSAAARDLARVYLRLEALELVRGAPRGISAADDPARRRDAAATASRRRRDASGATAPRLRHDASGATPPRRRCSTALRGRPSRRRRVAGGARSSAAPRITTGTLIHDTQGILRRPTRSRSAAAARNSERRNRFRLILAALDCPPRSNAGEANANARRLLAGTRSSARSSRRRRTSNAATARPRSTRSSTWVVRIRAPCSRTCSWRSRGDPDTIP